MVRPFVTQAEDPGVKTQLESGIFQITLSVQEMGTQLSLEQVKAKTKRRFTPPQLHHSRYKLAF